MKKINFLQQASAEQREVAEKLGLHQQTIAKYEKDSTKIPMDLLRQLSELYKVKLDHIFLG